MSDNNKEKNGRGGRGKKPAALLQKKKTKLEITCLSSLS